MHTKYTINKIRAYYYNYWIYIFIFNVSQFHDDSINSNTLQMIKQLNQNNNHVTVLVDVSYTSENFNNVKNFIRDKRCPLFFKLKESGIVGFEWFINKSNSNGTLIEVFENTNAWEELGNKVLDSPMNLKFRELFKIENLTVLEEVN